MRLQLDTHSLLWFIEGDKQLSSYSRNLIENTDNEVFVSIISFFEVAIKLRLGKMELSKPLESIYQDTLTAEIRILPVRLIHLTSYHAVSLFANHRDPFDRLLIATALHEQCSIITIDEKFNYYTDLIDVIW